MGEEGGRGGGLRMEHGGVRGGRAFLLLPFIGSILK